MDKCPYCKRPVESGDTWCPQCARSITPQKSEPWFKHVPPYGWVAIALLVVLIILGTQLLIQKTQGGQVAAQRATVAPKSTTGDRITAFEACKGFVADILKAPKSADFQNQFESQVTEYQPGRWEVIAYVDAQNSFGANIRTHFMCHIKHAGDFSYSLEELKINE